MEFYIAIPKSVIDIYWNGYPETSNPLGMFIVKPEMKKGLHGKQNIVGFNEIITGDKIVDRIRYATEFGFEYEDIDCMIDNEMQIGDITWEIVDKSTAETMLSPEKLKNYMSMKPEEISSQLSNIREQAKVLGQKCRKFTPGYKRRNISPNDTYIAIPKGVIDIYWNKLPEKSESLGMFIVKPEMKKGLLGKQNVAGFNEVITGEKIVNRIRYATDAGFEYEDIDCMIDNEMQIGDIAWEIIDKSTAERMLSPEELKNYMSIRPEEISSQLLNVREQAKILGQKYENGTIKK